PVRSAGFQQAETEVAVLEVAEEVVRRQASDLPVEVAFNHQAGPRNRWHGTIERCCRRSLVKALERVVDEPVVRRDPLLPELHARMLDRVVLVEELAPQRSDVLVGPMRSLQGAHPAAFLRDDVAVQKEEVATAGEVRTRVGRAGEPEVLTELDNLAWEPEKLRQLGCFLDERL